jgi:lipopolysaccharide/colanic/teichoic acid biosynthesis glycosyltransferase
MSTTGKAIESGTESAPGQSPIEKAPRRSPVRPSSYFTWKRLFDRFVAAVLLVPAAPVIAILILLVRMTSRGPGLYRQTRVGMNGRTFPLYKLRSMRIDAEAGTGAVWCKSNDSRITPLGGFLRASHLDEFPQLWNVLRGEMSLVGPRPERPEFVSVLAAQIPGYLDRLAVPPGVTGVAQLNLPPDTDLNSVRRKLTLDLEYVEKASLLLDIRILVCTALRMLKIPGLGMLGLRRVVPLFEEALHVGTLRKQARC